MWLSIVRLLGVGILAAVHVALLLAVLRSTRRQFVPTLSVIVACLLSLMNSGIPFGSQSLDWMNRGGMADLEAGRLAIRELGQRSLLDAGVWSFLLLAIVLTRPMPESVALPPAT